MVDVTLFELHLTDAQFNAPFSGSGETTESDGAAADETADSAAPTPESAVSIPAAFLAGVAALTVAAWLLGRWRRSADDDDP